MKNIYFTVGPTQLYPKVPAFIRQAIRDEVMSKSHRGGWFQKLFSDLTTSLRELLNIPASHHIFFVSSGTESMERSIENTVIKNSFHFVNGAFSKRFYKTAKELGKSPQQIEVPPGQSFDFQKVVIPKNTETICFTHNETSTGVMLPMQKIYSIKKEHPDKLVAVDVVSSIPYVDIDYKKIDIVFFSVQKGFGLSAGLGVIIVSPQAYKKSEFISKKGFSTGSYHSFSELAKYATRNETPETPNVFDMFLLYQVTKDMHKQGIKKIRKSIEKRALKIEGFIEKSKRFSYLVKNKAERSKTIHVVRDKHENKNLMAFLKQKHIIVSSGYGELKNTYTRIACFPAHTDAQVRLLISHLKVYLNN